MNIILIKVNCLGSRKMIGQLFIHGKPTDEVMAVSYGMALGLNSDRSWTQISAAGSEFTLKPIKITLHGLVQETEKDIEVPANKY
jgi:hypothetical protein